MVILRRRKIKEFSKAIAGGTFAAFMIDYLLSCLVDNMLLKGVGEKHSASDSKTDHELSSLHRRRRGALSFYNHIGSFVSVIVNLVITSLVIVVEFTSF